MKIRKIVRYIDGERKRDNCGKTMEKINYLRKPPMSRNREKERERERERREREREL